MGGVVGLCMVGVWWVYGYKCYSSLVLGVADNQLFSEVEWVEQST